MGAISDFVSNTVGSLSPVTTLITGSITNPLGTASDIAKNTSSSATALIQNPLGTIGSVLTNKYMNPVGGMVETVTHISMLDQAKIAAVVGTVIVSWPYAVAYVANTSWPVIVANAAKLGVTVNQFQAMEAKKAAQSAIDQQNAADAAKMQELAVLQGKVAALPPQKSGIMSVVTNPIALAAVASAFLL
jgi:hypothetical protein